jgi:hypothetical protein
MRYPVESSREDEGDRFARRVRPSRTLRLSKLRWEGRRLSVPVKHRDRTRFTARSAVARACDAKEQTIFESNTGPRRLHNALGAFEYVPAPR